MERAQENSRKPIMLRAELSDEEWLRIRQAALAEGTTTSKFVGALLREALKAKEDAA